LLLVILLLPDGGKTTPLLSQKHLPPVAEEED
jgi:hypothetical protein